jgi:hypothetical protein
MAIKRFAVKDLLAKIETTYGVDPGDESPVAAIVAGDAIETRQLQITRYDGDRISNEIDRPTLGNYADINVSPAAVVQFSVGMQGSGAAATAVAYDSLLRACGLSVALSSPSSGGNVYTPRSTGYESVTLHYEDADMIQIISGARGNLGGTLARKQLPVFNISNLRGFYSRPTTVSPVTPNISDFFAPIPVTNTNTPTLSFFGYSGLRLESFTFDMGNQMAYHDTTNAREIFITDRKPTGQLVVAATDISTFNPWASGVESHASLTTGVLQLIHGSVAGKIVKFDAPAVQIANITESNVDGLMFYTYDLKFLPSSGDDEIQITTK